MVAGARAERKVDAAPVLGRGESEPGTTRGAGPGRAERTGAVAVGRDHDPGTPAQAGAGNADDAIAFPDQVADPVALQETCARGLEGATQGIVEVDAPHDQARLVVASLDARAVGEDRRRAVDDRVRGRAHGIPRTEFVEQPDRPARERVAADLVARKDGRIDHADVDAGAGEHDAGGTARRPCTDHDDVACALDPAPGRQAGLGRFRPHGAAPDGNGAPTTEAINPALRPCRRTTAQMASHATP